MVSLSKSRSEPVHREGRTPRNGTFSNPANRVAEAAHASAVSVRTGRQSIDHRTADDRYNGYWDRGTARSLRATSSLSPVTCPPAAERGFAGSGMSKIVDQSDFDPS